MPLKRMRSVWWPFRAGNDRGMVLKWLENLVAGAQLRSFLTPKTLRISLR